MMQDVSVMTVQETAQLADVHITTVRRWARAGLNGTLLTPSGEDSVHGGFTFLTSDVQRFLQTRRNHMEAMGIELPPLPEVATNGQAVPIPLNLQDIAQLPKIQIEGVTIKLLRVTPKMAERWLNTPRSLPNISEKLTYSYRRDMEHGRWRFNGDAIRFDADGELIDGQHRLTSIVRSGKRQILLVIFGLDPAAKHTIDVGRKRMLADILRMRGFGHATIVSGASAILWQLEDGVRSNNLNRSPSLSRDEGLACIDRYPGLSYSAAICAGVNSGSPSTLTALHCLFATIDRDKADLFVTALKYGEGLSQGDARLILRDRFFSTSPHHRMSRTLIGALTIKAWNAWYGETPLRILRFNPETDSFPSITGLEVQS